MGSDTFMVSDPMKESDPKKEATFQPCLSPP
jgi:hypothetical protein